MQLVFPIHINILVVDRLNPTVRKDFFDEEYETLDKAIYDAYSLESWIKEILF